MRDAAILRMRFIPAISVAFVQALGCFAHQFETFLFELGATFRVYYYVVLSDFVGWEGEVVL